MRKTKSIELTAAQSQRLDQFMSSGTTKARYLKHAQILAKLAQGWRYQTIAATFNCAPRTVSRIKQRFEREGLEAALVDKARSGKPRRIDGATKALVVATACASPPTGRVRWTLRLLTNRILELGLAEQLSHTTVRAILKKNELKPWRRQQWCIPSVSAPFVAAMEEILELNTTPYNPKRPKVCLDEKVVYLLQSLRPNWAMRPGSCAKEDCEYERSGSCNLFVVVEPQAGWRHILVREQRTGSDYAQVLRWLVDEAYPDAEEIELIQDNLNTHGPASLYRTFAPAEARRILRKIRFRYTPKHGSWLNMAEIEIGIFERQCLDRRIGSQAELEREVAALEAQRNAAHATINWQFSCEQARAKLRHLYPKLEAEAQAQSQAS